MRILQRIALLASLMLSLAAQAQTAHLPNEAPFALDATGAFLVGVHPQDTSGYIDGFEFTVDAPSLVSGIFLLPGLLSPLVDPASSSDLASPIAFLLFDSTGTPLAYNVDGSNSFALQASLPGAGTYAFLTVGAGGAGLGLYAVFVVSQALPLAVATVAAMTLTTSVLSVPEPTVYAMLLAGLALVAWMARRRRSAH
jgi:hypothetical protein